MPLGRQYDYAKRKLIGAFNKGKNYGIIVCGGCNMKFIAFFLFSLGLVNARAQVTGTIHVMGDSLAYGTGASNLAMSPTNCLKKGFPQSEVLNEAVPGTKSDKFLKGLSAWTPAANSQMVFVSMGGNDVIGNLLSPGSFPEQNSLINMNLIFDSLQKPGIVVVYLGLAPPRPDSDRLPLISLMAENRGVIVVDGMDGLWNKLQYMSDPVHPNAKGYALMCDKILQALQEYVP